MAIKTNLGESFRKLIDDTFVRHNGCLIEKKSSGYATSFDRRWHPTLEEAKQHIDKSFINIQNSIQNGNKKESSSSDNQS